jgi:hypothetical protein
VQRAIYSGTQEKEGEIAMNLSAILKFVAAGTVAVAMAAAPLVAKAQGADTILKPAEMQKLLPASVWYKGQSATTQLRNAGGVKFEDGYFVLATLVDTSGYSTDVQAKYQAYFVSEIPLKFAAQTLPAGVYGVGFIAGDKFVITDVGAHELLTASTGTDSGLKRPMPLQVMADPAGGFRLYSGRRFVVFSR